MYIFLHTILQFLWLHTGKYRKSTLKLLKSTEIGLIVLVISQLEFYMDEAEQRRLYSELFGHGHVSHVF